MNLDTVFSPIKEELEVFDRKLKKSLDSDSPLIYQIANHILERKGKRLRPALVYLSAKANGGKNEKLTLAALAIELLHTATLLHDDVVDQSQTRRGQKTVNSGWSNLISVLMGDYLFAKAFKIMMATKSSPLLQAISKATERVSFGELLQVQECFNYDLDEKLYLDIIREKTASLFSVSCESGVILSKNDNNHKRNFQSYGENFGIAFQITDDLLDLIGKKEKTGKELGNDLKEGKMTLPLIYAFNRSSQKAKKEIIKLIENSFDHNGFFEILNFVQNQGGVDYAKSRAFEFGERALDFISNLKDSESKDSLINLVNFMVNRER
jgi:octaprenyl-diphosphate synthase